MSATPDIVIMSPGEGGGCLTWHPWGTRICYKLINSPLSRVIMLSFPGVSIAELRNSVFRSFPLIFVVGGGAY